MNWTEKQEVALLEAVAWVEEKFEGKSGKEMLSQMGGKWAVVGQVVRKNCEEDISDEACKSRFFNIKGREKHVTTDDGEVIVFDNTDFPQVDKDEIVYHVLDPDGLEDRVRDLESQVALLEKQIKNFQKVANTMHSLNEHFKTLFAMSS